MNVTADVFAELLLVLFLVDFLGYVLEYLPAFYFLLACQLICQRRLCTRSYVLLIRLVWAVPMTFPERSLRERGIIEVVFGLDVSDGSVGLFPQFLVPDHTPLLLVVDDDAGVVGEDCLDEAGGDGGP